MSDSKTQSVRSTVGLVTVIAFVLVVTTIIAFFISVRSAEETQVPAVVGEDWLSAVLQLQEKGLVAKFEGRFSINVEQGQIMTQTPVAGS